MTIKEKYLNPDFIDSFWMFGNLEKYGVKVDLFAEDGGHCKAYGVKPCVYFRNGYDDYTDEKLPLILCEDPYIPFDFGYLNILPSDFCKLCDLIAKNRNYFIKMCNKEIDIFDDCELLGCKTDENNLCTISLVKPIETGLPMNIWMDNGDAYEKTTLGKRLKFKNKDSDDDSTTLSYITIPDLELVGETDRPAKEIDLIRSFYIQNKSLVDKILSNKITKNYFLDHIVHVDGHGNPLKKEVNFYIYHYDDSFGFDVIMDNNGKFNYYDKSKNKVISNVWFDKAYRFWFYYEISRNPLGEVFLDDEIYYITSNGKLFTL